MSVSPIIEKVQKLLALSKSCNANEAAAAAAVANRLIDQYRLSEADLDADVEGELEPIEEDSDYLYQSGKITAWKQTLVSILVKHYGCAYWNDATYASGRKVTRYKLVGKRSDVGIVRYMFATGGYGSEGMRASFRCILLHGIRSWCWGSVGVFPCGSAEDCNVQCNRQD
jgi:hypothetical protein